MNIDKVSIFCMFCLFMTTSYSSSYCSKDCVPPPPPNIHKKTPQKQQKVFYLEVEFKKLFKIEARHARNCSKVDFLPSLSPANSISFCFAQATSDWVGQSGLLAQVLFLFQYPQDFHSFIPQSYQSPKTKQIHNCGLCMFISMLNNKFM